MALVRIPLGEPVAAQINPAEHRLQSAQFRSRPFAAVPAAFMAGGAGKFNLVNFYRDDYSVGGQTRFQDRIRMIVLDSQNRSTRFAANIQDGEHEVFQLSRDADSEVRNFIGMRSTMNFRRHDFNLHGNSYQWIFKEGFADEVVGWVRDKRTAQYFLEIWDGIADEVKSPKISTFFSFRAGDPSALASTAASGVPSAIPFEFDVGVRGHIQHQPEGTVRPILNHWVVTVRGSVDHELIALPGISDQDLDVGQDVHIIFSPATGGVGKIAYTLSRTVPGLRFDVDTLSLIGNPSEASNPIQLTLRAEDEAGNFAESSFTVYIGRAIEPQVRDLRWANLVTIFPRGESPEYRLWDGPNEVIIEGRVYQPGILLGAQGFVESLDGTARLPSIELVQGADLQLDAALNDDFGVRRIEVALAYLDPQSGWTIFKRVQGRSGESAPEEEDSIYRLEIDPPASRQLEQLPLDWTPEFQKNRYPGDEFFRYRRQLARSESPPVVWPY